MLQSLTDKQPEIRQAASYGIGIMAQFGGNGYAQVCAGAYLNEFMQIQITPD